MGDKIPPIKPKEMIKILEKLGYYKFRQKGSHVIMVKADNVVFQPVIPIHNQELKRGTVFSIIRQTGLTKEEFLKIRKNK